MSLRRTNPSGGSTLRTINLTQDQPFRRHNPFGGTQPLPEEQPRLLEDITTVLKSVQSTISVWSARVALVSCAAALVLLASLHVLSPEFDPAVRMISEYANGAYGAVLSLMFVLWAISSLAVAAAIAKDSNGNGGRIGLALLVISGIGEAMGGLFDINHPLHDLAGFLGVLTMPAAAMLISLALSRKPEWQSAKAALLWSANLTWISLLLFVVAMVVLIIGYTQAGNRLTPDVIALAGYANRLFVIAYCAWTLLIAWHYLHISSGPDARAATLSTQELAQA